jgi:hypothetical protein
VWCGWYRRGPQAPWQKAVEAPTLDGAASALTAWLQAQGLRLHNLDQCLTGGGVPTVLPRGPDPGERNPLAGDKMR